VVNSTPDNSSLELARRLHASAALCRVVSAQPLNTSMHEIVLSGDAPLAGVPGNDVMIRVKDATGRFVRRRYSVRAHDPETNRVTLWIVTAHDGPGSAWARSCQAGDEVDVVGPRGKIPLAADADWHVFIGDASGLGAFYRMAQSIEVPGRAIFIVELDNAEDALTAPFDEGLGVTGIFVDRNDRARNDPSGLLSGLAAFALPPDDGHAYLFGEFSVSKVLRDALLDRGLRDEQISRKAFWRAGRTNAEHGEPDKGDD
jgi:NADPH-dependent ferric siderophore reductase